MALKFIIGRCGSGKSTIALKSIAKKQSENPGHNLILMVPEQFSLQAEKDIIRETSGKGIIGAKVLSFHRLAYTIFKETGMPKRKPFSDISQVMALKKVILDNKENLVYFNSATEKKGFINQLVLTINEFFSYTVPTDKLLSLKNNIPSDSILNNKLSDLLILYEGYKDFLSNGYIASEQSLDILYTRMDESSLIKSSELWLDGFYGFTPQELKIIEKLLIHTQDVTVLLTMDDYALNTKGLPMSHVFYEPKETYLALLEIAKRVNVAVDKPEFLEKIKRFKTASLHSLENEYTCHTIKKQPSHEGISLYVAKNVFDESEYIATKIISLVRDKGYHYRDIAVLAGDLNEYENIFSNVMDQCEIPYFMDSKREIENHPFVFLVKGVLEMVLYNFSFDSVFSFLKTNLTPFHNESIEILENYCLAYGIKGYKWKLPNWSFGMTSETDPDKYLFINRLKKQLINYLSPILSIDLKKKYPISEISHILLSVLEELDVPGRLESLTDELTSGNNLSKASETKQCWNIFTEIMESLEEILGTSKVTLKEYYGLLESGFSGSKLGIIPPSIDNVIIGNLERTRLPKVKALFLIGVNDGVIPSSSVAEGILGNEERLVLEQKGLSLSHDAIRLAFEENYLIYSAITKSEELVFISYSAWDLGGHEKFPSSIISKIRRIFPTLPLETSIEEAERFSSPALAFHNLGEELKVGKNPLWFNSLEYFETNGKWKNRTLLLKKGLNTVPAMEYLSENTARSAFGKDLYSSVSRLEKFSSCPYSYFLGYTMKAEERKVYQLRTPDLGLLFHGVLENFSNKLKEEKLDWRNIKYEKAMSMVNDCVDIQVPKLSNEILLSSSSMQYLIRRLKRICLRSIWTLHNHLKQGSFTPFDYELDFGKNGALPSIPHIAIDLKDGDKMFLSGKIDRVDILKADGSTYVKIIDYKSGNKDFNLSDVYYGLQLQLLIYLDSLIKNGNLIFNEDVLPGGVFYFRIKDPMITCEDEISADEIEELISEKLRMSGLILNDPKVIMGFDNTSDKKSKIVPIEYTKDGLSKKSSVVDLDTYNALQKYAIETAGALGERIKSGDIAVSPYKTKDATPCNYCSYKSVCGFEDDSSHFTARSLKKIESSQAIEKIKKDLGLCKMESMSRTN